MVTARFPIRKRSAFCPSPINLHRPLILTFSDSALNLSCARSPGNAKMQGRNQAGKQGREMRQRMQMTQRMGRRTPRAAGPGLFPALPMPLFGPSLDHDPSTQPGTPRWTHHPVTRSKQSVGVEAARNSIPTRRTIQNVEPLPALSFLHHKPTRQCEQGGIRYNSLKTITHCKVYPSLTRAIAVPNRMTVRNNFGFPALRAYLSLTRPVCVPNHESPITSHETLLSLGSRRPATPWSSTNHHSLITNHERAT
jgi:hypothetical protein